METSPSVKHKDIMNELNIGGMCLVDHAFAWFIFVPYPDIMPANWIFWIGFDIFKLGSLWISRTGAYSRVLRPCQQMLVELQAKIELALSQILAATVKLSN